ncbi:MAG: tyrosine recombinase [Kiritimatiellae bacterium]|nr:tyrosine recombinase [Kiritimatiellia bacterium]
MTSLASCADAFAADLALARGLSPRTVEAYGRDVRAFLAFLAARGKTTPDALARVDVADHVGALRAAGRRASTRARAFVAVREFLAFLASTHATAGDLSEGLEAPKKNLVLLRVLDEQTTLKILQSADGEDPRSLRDRAMLEFLYGCGLRVSELCGLELQDVIADAGVVRCCGKGSKERIVPVGLPAAKALARYLESARESFARGNAAERRIFLTRLGRPFTRMGVFKMLRERAASAGVDARTVSPHVLRHCFATDLLAHGADIRAIQEMLGHASIATTQVYTHVDRARLAAVHRTYHPRADFPPDGASGGADPEK